MRNTPSTASGAEPAAPANGSQPQAILSREAILSAEDITTELVAVPEWGGSVYVRAMSGRERDRFERAMVSITGKNVETNWDNMRAKLVAFSCVDSEGNLLFRQADVVELGKKSGRALGRVFDVAQRINGITDEEVEALTTGLKDDPSGDSGSG